MHLWIIIPDSFKSGSPVKFLDSIFIIAFIFLKSVITSHIFLSVFSFLQNSFKSIRTNQNKIGTSKSLFIGKIFPMGEFIFIGRKVTLHLFTMPLFMWYICCMLWLLHFLYEFYMDYDLVENDFVCLTSDSLTTFLLLIWLNL